MTRKWDPLSFHLFRHLLICHGTLALCWGSRVGLGAGERKLAFGLRALGFGVEGRFRDQVAGSAGRLMGRYWRGYLYPNGGYM